MLLGGGGLVRAYSHSASIALKKIGIVTMQLCSQCSLTCTYTQYGKIPATIAQFQGVVDDSEFTDFVTVKFHLPCDNLSSLNTALSEITCGAVEADEHSKSFFEQKKQ